MYMIVTWSAINAHMKSEPWGKGLTGTTRLIELHTDLLSFILSWLHNQYSFICLRYFNLPIFFRIVSQVPGQLCEGNG